MNQDMVLAQNMFSTVKKAIGDNRALLDQLTTTSQTAETAFAPTLYATLADADLAMVGYAKPAFSFISDVVDVGESPGAGTGALCVWKPNPIDEWRLVATNVGAII